MKFVGYFQKNIWACPEGQNLVPLGLFFSNHRKQFYVKNWVFTTETPPKQSQLKIFKISK